MRLSKNIVEALIAVIAKHLKIFAADGVDLYLFGSRADDSKLGGDIDLLLLTNEKTKNRLKEKNYVLIEELREAAGDQKVDLTIKTFEEAKSDAFVKSLSLVKLWSVTKR